MKTILRGRDPSGSDPDSTGLRRCFVPVRHRLPSCVPGIWACDPPIPARVDPDRGAGERQQPDPPILASPTGAPVALYYSYRDDSKPARTGEDPGERGCTA